MFTMSLHPTILYIRHHIYCSMFDFHDWSLRIHWNSCLQRKKQRLMSWLLSMLPKLGIWHLRSVSSIYKRLKMHTTNAKSTATTRSSLQCRSMKWWGAESFVLRLVYCDAFCKTHFLYFQVDKHIRRLDADLARFENDLQEKLDSGIQDSSDEKHSLSKCYNVYPCTNITRWIY